MAASNPHALTRCVPFISLIVFSYTLFPSCVEAQTDSLADKKKLNTIAIFSAVGYTGALIALNHVWYKDTKRQSFHFFNDNAEWKQADKAGHFFASFYLGYATANLLRQGHVAPKKANLLGAFTGFLMTVPIEIMDGFSDGYGASWGDAVADAAGPAFFSGQQFLWNEIRIFPKFSFHRTAYPHLRPELLGDNLVSEIVKDYNGQTYWLSFDMDKFTTFPKWLNVALGYGAQEMIYARDRQNQAAGYDPYRQYYISIDFDLSAIKTRSKVVKTLIFIVNAIKLPAPAVSYSKNGSHFHAFYH